MRVTRRTSRTCPLKRLNFALVDRDACIYVVEMLRSGYVVRMPVCFRLCSSRVGRVGVLGTCMAVCLGTKYFI
jgi:hypothetical protein